jgi:hypothetical protein
MSATSAKTHAMRARRATNTDEKLTYLAQAIYELAQSVASIEADVHRIKNATRG